jgi:hypothetical protein
LRGDINLTGSTLLQGSGNAKAEEGEGGETESELHCLLIQPQRWEENGEEVVREGLECWKLGNVDDILALYIDYWPNPNVYI